MQDKADLIISALQQRIGELSADYELRIALLRAELTNLVEEKNKLDLDKAEAITENSKEIQDKISGA